MFGRWIREQTRMKDLTLIIKEKTMEAGRTGDSRREEQIEGKVIAVTRPEDQNLPQWYIDRFL